MSKILYIKKKLGTSYLVWFKNSNLYFYLQEPAWFVFQKIIHRYKSESIAKEFSIRYGLSYDDSINFVEELRLKIKEINQPRDHKKYIEKYTAEISEHVYSNYSSHFYNMQNKVIKFSYETSWLENWVHPLIEHLEGTDELTNTTHFELFTFENRVIFRVDKVLVGSWQEDESPFVKGSVYVQLLNVLHNKTDSDWLMTVHASAISNGRKTMLFSASAGSGKTTFAALLQANGYHIISDDFVSIEKSTFKAYPLPIAMSVKEGSIDLLSSHYPELNKNSLIEINQKKKIQYLPVDTKIINMIFPVNEFVFIKYDKTVDLLLEKTAPVDALQKLFEEAWIPPDTKNVEIFLNKIFKASFYNLTYSNNGKAMEAINQLFEND